MYKREELENLINNDPLFGIDKESNRKLYETQRTKFFELLVKYYQAYIYPNRHLQDYGYTLIETASECLKYFDRTKGEFLHLFNNSMKRELMKAKAKAASEKYRQGIHISTEDEQRIRKIVALAKHKNLDIYDSTVQAKIGIALGISPDEVANLIKINDNAVAVTSTVTNDDGDEVELFDLQVSHEKSAEDKLVEETAWIELIERINNLFNAIQDRQKKLISMLLTTEIIKALDYDIHQAKRLLKDTQMFSLQVFDYYEQNGQLLTAKQIGTLCGVSEQSLSRTYKNFKEKIQTNS